MTDKEKLEKIKVLADKMYSRMAYLTSDTRPIRQAMDEYHQFIINEYHKEEPVSEDLDKAVVEYMSQFLGENYYNSPWVMDSTGMAMPKELARFGAKWQKDKMMQNTIDAQCFGFQGDALFSFRLPADNYLVGSEVKVIVIKKDEL